MPNDAAQAVRAALKTQYHAALEMLRQAIEMCPEDLWLSGDHTTRSWQLAYHTLFFAHLYMQRDEYAFRPWKHHQANAQYPDGIAGPGDPKSELPLLPQPYTKEQVLDYCRFCRKSVDRTVDELDVLSPQSGFSWYRVSKLEHQIVNIRHIQHGAAQLADRVRTVADVGVDWVGAAAAPTPSDDGASGA